MSLTTSSSEALGSSYTPSDPFELFLSFTKVILASSSNTLLLHQLFLRTLPSFHQYLPHLFKHYNLSSTSTPSNSSFFPPTSCSPHQALHSCLQQLPLKSLLSSNSILLICPGITLLSTTATTSNSFHLPISSSCPLHTLHSVYSILLSILLTIRDLQESAVVW